MQNKSEEQPRTIMLKNTLDTYNNILLKVILVLFLTFPLINFSFTNIYFQISDLLLPFVCFSIIHKKIFQTEKVAIGITSIISLIILLSIIVNGQFQQWNNYFEIYDVIKILIYLIFFKQNLHKQNLSKTFNITFILLAVFNLLHYFNIFNFNELVMPLYCDSNNCNLNFFGLNSDGSPGPKRMLGTLCNPNTNAVIFLSFVIYYAPRQKEWTKTQKTFFFISIFFLLLCQSRTSLLALFVIIATNYLLEKIAWKKIFIQSSCIIGLIVLFFSLPQIFKALDINLFFDNSYSSTVTNSAFKSNSWKDRLELWKKTSYKIAKKPIIGHSPNKAYFYQNDIHTDNEYISVAYKYGIIGILSYLSVFIIPAIFALRKKFYKKIIEAKNIILFICTFAIIAITNAPFNNPRISIIFVIALAAFWHKLDATAKDEESI